MRDYQGRDLLSQECQENNNTRLGTRAETQHNNISTMSPITVGYECFRWIEQDCRGPCLRQGTLIRFSRRSAVLLHK